MPHDPSRERYAVFVNDELAERAPVFKSRELARQWLAQRSPGEGYTGAAVRNVREEAARLRVRVRELTARADALDATITPVSPKAESRQRNRLRREATKLSTRIVKLNAIRYPGKAIIRPSAGNELESRRGPYSRYGTASYVAVLPGGLPGLGKKR